MTAPFVALSMRGRVVITVALVLLLFAALSTVAVIRTVRDAISEEVEASMTLARNLSTALIRIGGEAESGSDLAALVATLSSIRHVRIGYRSMATPNALAHAMLPDPDPDPGPATTSVPAWFERLALPTRLPPHVVLRLSPPGRGMLLLAPYAYDELLESWQEARIWLLFLGIALAVACLAIFIVVGRSLRPLVALDGALQRIQGGDLGATLRGPAVPEITRLNHRFNDMAGSLRAATEENRRLARALAEIQTRERRWLARELHDEMSPTLFKIRVDLHGVMSRLAKTDEHAALHARLDSAHQLVVEQQQWVRRLLRDLYPLVLDELGLVAAIQSLIEEWRRRLPEVTWVFGQTLDELGLDATTTSNVYRIVEEALVNAARHAGASEVRVSLGVSRGAGESSESGWLTLTVEDDGGGDPARLKPNIGLRSMRDRARSIGGDCTVGARAPRGLRIEVRVPLAPEWDGDAASAPPAHGGAGE